MWSLCFLYIYVYGSKACAALHLGHSSRQLLSKHAHRYFFKFFCTQENSFPFPFVLKWCVFISLFHLPCKKLLFRTRMSSFSGCSVPVHITRFLPSASSQPCLKKSFSSVSVFLSSAHTLQRHLSACSMRISPLGLGHFLPTAN